MGDHGQQYQTVFCLNAKSKALLLLLRSVGEISWLEKHLFIMFVEITGILRVLAVTTFLNTSFFLFP